MVDHLEDNEGESEDSSALDNMVAMSDEDFLAMEAPEDVVIDTKETDTESEDDSIVGDEQNDEVDGDVDVAESAGEESDATLDTPTEDVPAEKDEPAKVESTSSEDFMKAILAPFNANGREMQVANADEARTLIKMGANYNKKMSALKPNLKLMKMLDNNGLLDENKLSYLIDISKKDPDAIARLIQESGIDPLDIDVKKEKDYKPKTYTVSDEQVVLDDVLEDIRDTGTFQTTMDIVNNKWDAASQDTLVRTPNLLKVINDHVASGIYDQITKVVEKERMLGKLVGVSDIAAYKVVGDSIFAQQAKVDTPANVVPDTLPAAKPVAKDDSKAKARKLAASTPKGKQRTTIAEPDFNPLTVPEDQLDALCAKFL